MITGRLRPGDTNPSPKLYNRPGALSPGSVARWPWGPGLPVPDWPDVTIIAGPSCVKQEWLPTPTGRLRPGVRLE